MATGKDETWGWLPPGETCTDPAQSHVPTSRPDWFAPIFVVGFPVVVLARWAWSEVALRRRLARSTPADH